MKPDASTASSRKKPSPSTARQPPPPEWSRPISEREPCGPNLEYEPEYAALAARLEPQSEAQYGDFVDRPAPPDWSDVERQCRQLLQRSKDLNLLIWLARCRTRLGGAPGLLEILDMLQTLLRTYPDTLHPQHRIEGELDPAVRANALASLADPEGLLADLRLVTISTHHAQRLSVRDVERAFELPRHPESLPTEQVRQQLQDLLHRHHQPVLALQAIAIHARQIEQWAQQDLGEHAPDLGPLLRLLAPFAELAAPSQGADASASSTVGADPGPDALPLANEAPAMPPFRVASEPAPPSASTRATETDAAPPSHPRETLRQQLRQARHWLEEHEPSSPVALLLAQAERMLGKRYLELTHALPPDLVARWTEDTDPTGT
ncbi:ImpA family type VI secretion system protein [Curvibacter gracilis]|uniref:type VI secretion system protein TssA n=1 Tax=Curvibacter gracilis TaxID=230310 RepID=UPI0004B3FC26|nr:type VI secretion system ImpA family N-terminal domain-containing protein [Curvibacter gracilis]